MENYEIIDTDFFVHLAASANPCYAKWGGKDQKS